MSVQGSLIPYIGEFKMFQYILCVGSREDAVYSLQQVLEFQYILCVGSSIKPMDFDSVRAMFQYILCVGSS